MSESIKITRLTKTFDSLTAVDDVSFSARQGEVIALLGPNGAGKSTLMNMIAGYLAPTSGEIEVLGQSIFQNPLWGKQNIGFLPEGSPLYPDMTVRHFLNYMTELRDTTKTAMIEIIEQAKIKEVLDCKIETLSKGYQRRVGFAQSLLSNPPILLLDEPTDGLDPNQKEHIRALITEMGKEKTILISTHLLDEAEEIATRILIMNKGKILADGTLTRILSQTHTTILADAFKKLTR